MDGTQAPYLPGGYHVDPEETTENGGGRPDVYCSTGPPPPPLPFLAFSLLRASLPLCDGLAHGLGEGPFYRVHLLGRQSLLAEQGADVFQRLIGHPHVSDLLDDAR